MGLRRSWAIANYDQPPNILQVLPSGKLSHNELENHHAM